MKIGCLTFHASRNYGSSLQTYALKKAISSINENISYYVINLRSHKQDYSYLSPFKRNDLKAFYLRLFCLSKKTELEIKENRFNEFMNNEFNLTEEYDEKTIHNISDKFDIFLCGSDQVWNIKAYDFSWMYFLEFKTKAKKISYACSMGTKKIDLNLSESKRIESDLKSFSLISVRDLNTKNKISNLTAKNVYSCVDPTLLLTKKEWNELISCYESTSFENDYIFYYDLSHNKYNWILAKKIARKLKMKLIISSVPYPRVIRYSCGIKKDYSCGPIQFLNYIKNAKLVLTSSFHGLVFSTIFNVPFFTLNAESDERIFDFLKLVGFEDRNITNNDFKLRINSFNTIDFKKCNGTLSIKRNECLRVLKNNI